MPMQTSAIGLNVMTYLYYFEYMKSKRYVLYGGLEFHVKDCLLTHMISFLYSALNMTVLNVRPNPSDFDVQRKYTAEALFEPLIMLKFISIKTCYNLTGFHISSNSCHFDCTKEMYVSSFM